MKRYLSALVLIFTISIGLSGCGAKELYDNLHNNLSTSKCYVQTGDATKENNEYHYDLTGYDKEGNTKEVKFKENRELKKGAYLEVTLKADGEVKGWEEVSKDKLPEKVKDKMNVK